LTEDTEVRSPLESVGGSDVEGACLEGEGEGERDLRSEEVGREGKETTNEERKNASALFVTS